jgi:hypothetical protein
MAGCVVDGGPSAALPLKQGQDCLARYLTQPAELGYRGDGGCAYCPRCGRRRRGVWSCVPLDERRCKASAKPEPRLGWATRSRAMSRIGADLGKGEPTAGSAPPVDFARAWAMPLPAFRDRPNRRFPLGLVSVGGEPLLNLTIGSLPLRRHGSADDLDVHTTGAVRRLPRPQAQI